MPRAGRADSPAYAGELAGLGLNLLEEKKRDQRRSGTHACLTIREKQQPEAWTTFNTMSMLGGALLGRATSTNDASEKAQLLAQAEPLLLQGYEGMKARQEANPPQANTRIPEALDRLVELYTALKKLDEVAKYRELRAKYAEAKPTPMESSAMPMDEKE